MNKVLLLNEMARVLTGQTKREREYANEVIKI